MTVRECLEFCANLKFKGTEDQKKERVEQLILDLKLNKCQ